LLIHPLARASTLAITLCFSPVGKIFRSQTLKLPGLILGDWRLVPTLAQRGTDHRSTPSLGQYHAHGETRNAYGCGVYGAKAAEVGGLCARMKLDKLSETSDDQLKVRVNIKRTNIQQRKTTRMTTLTKKKTDEEQTTFRMNGQSGYDVSAGRCESPASYTRHLLQSSNQNHRTKCCNQTNRRPGLQPVQCRKKRKYRKLRCRLVNACVIIVLVSNRAGTPDLSLVC
jgi:hypothetical protein